MCVTHNNVEIIADNIIQNGGWHSLLPKLTVNVFAAYYLPADSIVYPFDFKMYNQSK